MIWIGLPTTGTSRGINEVTCRHRLSPSASRPSPSDSMSIRSPYAARSQSGRDSLAATGDTSDG